jgi:hypothetical protein
MSKTYTLLAAAPAVFALAVVACSTDVGQSEGAANVSQAAASCSAVYGQCGGQGWTGATCCVASTCTFSNQFYSQCLPGSGGSSSGGSSGSGSNCPNGANDGQQRAAASAAFSIMRSAASACANSESGAFGGPCFGTDILASQRYTFSGNTVVFDPSDAEYGYVPQAAKVALAVAQLDSSVASFFVSGLQWARANTNGNWVPVMMPIQALAHFTYPGNKTPIQIVDGAAGGNRRSEVVTATAWCNTADIHFADTSTYEQNFAPFNVIDVQHANDTNAALNFKGSNTYPTTPFNGPGNANNPYLVIALNGQQMNWNTPAANWPTTSCNASPPCTGSIDIDPIPYTQPGDYYDINGNEIGPQGNPFALIITNQFADPSHAGQWATRIVGGVQQWGTFSNPVNVLGSTVYQYVKQM